MRFARKILNFGFRQIQLALEDESDKFSIAVFQVVMRAIHRREAISAPYYAKYCRDATYLLSKSVAETPYGEELRFSSPLVVSIGLSSYCPLSCSTCYSDSKPQKKLKNATISLEAIKDLSSTRTPSFIITGGEPLLDIGIFEKVEILLKSGKKVYVATNWDISLLLPLLSDYPGQLSFIFSVWGHTKEHDRVRGVGSYKRILDNLRKIDSNKSSSLIFALVDKFDDDFLRCLLEIGKCNNDKVLRFVRNVGVGRRETLKPAQIAVELSTLESAKKHLVDVYQDIIFDFPEFRSAAGQGFAWCLIRSLFGIEVRSTCSAGSRMAHVGPNRNLYPCFAFEEASSHAHSLEHGIDHAWESVTSSFGKFRLENRCAAEAFTNE